MSLIHYHATPPPTFQNFAVIFLLCAEQWLSDIKEKMKLQNNEFIKLMRQTCDVQKASSTQEWHWTEVSIQPWRVSSAPLNKLIVKHRDIGVWWRMESTFLALFPNSPKQMQDIQSNGDQGHLPSASAGPDMLWPEKIIKIIQNYKLKCKCSIKTRLEPHTWTVLPRPISSANIAVWNAKKVNKDT